MHELRPQWRRLLELADYLEKRGGSRELIVGWSCEIIPRSAGGAHKPGDFYVNYYNERDERFRSMPEVARHFRLRESVANVENSQGYQLALSQKNSTGYLGVQPNQRRRGVFTARHGKHWIGWTYRTATEAAVARAEYISRNEGCGSHGEVAVYAESDEDEEEEEYESEEDGVEDEDYEEEGDEGGHEEGEEEGDVEGDQRDEVEVEVKGRGEDEDEDDKRALQTMWLDATHVPGVTPLIDLTVSSSLHECAAIAAKQRL